MSQEYTIQSVDGEREWSGQYGPMISYQLRLAGVDGIVETNRKPTSPKPEVGETMFGEIKQSSNPEFPPKFKAEKPAFTPGRNGRSPADTRAIQRQHSQEMAIRYLELTGEDNATLERVSELADFFDKDISTGKSLPIEEPAEKTAMPF